MEQRSAATSCRCCASECVDIFSRALEKRGFRSQLDPISDADSKAEISPTYFDVPIVAPEPILCLPCDGPEVHDDGSGLFGEEDVVRLEVAVRQRVGPRSVHVRDAVADAQELLGWSKDRTR